MQRRILLSGAVALAGATVLPRVAMAQTANGLLVQDAAGVARNSTGEDLQPAVPGPDPNYRVRLRRPTTGDRGSSAAWCKALAPGSTSSINPFEQAPQV